MDALIDLNTKNVELFEEITRLSKNNNLLNQISVSTHTFEPVKERGRPPKIPKTSTKFIRSESNEVTITLTTQSLSTAFSFYEVWSEVEKNGNIFRTVFPDTQYEDMEDDICRLAYLEEVTREHFIKLWHKALQSSHDILREYYDAIHERATWYNKVKALLDSEEVDSDDEFIEDTLKRKRVEPQDILTFKKANSNISFSDFILHIDQNTTWKEVEAFMILVKKCIN